jgi:hypothetical protein
MSDEMIRKRNEDIYNQMKQSKIIKLNPIEEPNAKSESKSPKKKPKTHDIKSLKTTVESIQS